MSDFPWGILGIAPTKDTGAIRKAYSTKLKALDVDDDVAGFALLRDARAEALYLAKQDDLSADDNVVQFSPLGTAADLAPIEASETKPQPEEEPAEEGPPPSTAPDDLLAILFPEQQPTEEPLTAEEYEAALAHMRDIISDAQVAQIDVQTRMEHWLAHYLASAWPRSGPLVEEASTAFSWDQDAGRIDEDPAVAFLNGRLDLIKRLEQIEDPSHKYHDAWVELKKPGPRGRFRWGQPKPEKIVGLIQAIRNEYPELENYLDPERVESWIDPKVSGLPGWAIGMLLLFALSAIGRTCSAVDPAPSLSDLDVNAPGAMNWLEEDQQAVVDAVMGPGVPLEALTLDLEGTAMIMAVATRGSEPTEAGFKLAEDGVRNSLRRAVADSTASASFEELLLIKTLKRDMLMLARDEGGNAECNWTLRMGSFSDNLEVPEDFKAKETQVFRTLYDAGRLGNTTGTVPTTASVPGDVIEEVMARLGRPVEDWDDIASNAEPSRARCDFEIALLDVVLKRPGAVSAELLRMM